MSSFSIVFVWKFPFSFRKSVSFSCVFEIQSCAQKVDTNFQINFRKKWKGLHRCHWLKPKIRTKISLTDLTDSYLPNKTCSMISSLWLRIKWSINVLLSKLLKLNYIHMTDIRCSFVISSIPECSVRTTDKNSFEFIV